MQTQLLYRLNDILVLEHAYVWCYDQRLSCITIFLIEDIPLTIEIRLSQLTLHYKKVCNQMDQMKLGDCNYISRIFVHM